MAKYKDTDKYIMNTYKRYPLTILSGKGSYLFDSDGRKYLDFIAGIAVCSLGHCPEVIHKTLSDQSKRLIHTSNLFYTIPQAELAGALAKKIQTYDKKLPLYKSFFCNSGAEANESAIKLARKFQKKNGQDRYEIITFLNSFHGRTYGAISATGQDKFHKGFEPMLPGFKYLPFNDIKSLKKAINKKTSAIMLELVQAEGGVNIIDVNFLKEIKGICEEEGVLLIYDEVQTGVGRTGRFFCFEHFGIEPHIITLAKGIAGGLPMGVMMAKEEIASAFEPGNHASTFGGNPLVSQVALEVISKMDKKFLKSVEKKGEYLIKSLSLLKEKYPLKDIRGLGLLIGADIDIKEPSKIIDKAMEKGLLVNITAGKTMRLVPPLTVSFDEIDEFISKLENTLKEVTR
ncbi:MAG: aspartate aminotransferase family protein [Proteobacteria bacterium]|nr:aspartate aminotransferase family protein [Pseudomonadota bacterium]